MRKILGGMGWSAVILLAGCNTFGFMHRDSQGRLEPLPSYVPTREDLVEYLNRNSQRVQTLRCDDLVVTVSHGVLSTDLHGYMMCQRPRNFMLTAGLLGKSEVDLGSNNDEFWYWIRRGDNMQIHCSYKDLNEGRVRRLPFPFQPEWVVEALGLGTYGPADQYELDTRDPEMLRLVARLKSPQGTPVRKVIVFRRRNTHADKGRPDPQVTDFQLLEDATGKEICASHIVQVRVDQPTGAILPYKVEMRWQDKENKLRMTMRLDGAAVNPQINAALAFRRRPLNGVPGFDLATMQQDAGVQRVQGVGQR
jgi:hypothetical protein